MSQQETGQISSTNSGTPMQNFLSNLQEARTAAQQSGDQRIQEAFNTAYQWCLTNQHMISLGSTNQQAAQAAGAGGEAGYTGSRTNTPIDTR